MVLDRLSYIVRLIWYSTSWIYVTNDGELEWGKKKIEKKFILDGSDNPDIFHIHPIGLRVEWKAEVRLESFLCDGETEKKGENISEPFRRVELH